MCTTHDSRPPIEPISGADANSESILLTAADGAEFRAFQALPKQATGAGIVILPDVRGLHPFFEELALRFAERGVAAIAIDYFCRTAGTEARSDDFDYQPHVEQVQWDNTRGEIVAAVKQLRSLDNPPRSIFATGFCMGGRLASLSLTLGLGLAGAIPFYGWPTGTHRSGSPAPADVADKIEADLLLIYGGADKGISADVREAYDRALDKAGVQHETIVYPDAPHSFFDRNAAEFADASQDAWDKTLKFIGHHTMGQPIAAPAPKG
jgi:carboxymethylenebutenolidase